ncbi:hypothetical protein [Streptomyces sp. NPDC005435]
MSFETPTPSQAEGEREPDVEIPGRSVRRDVPRTTPSQAEGEDPDEETD